MKQIAGIEELQERLQTSRIVIYGTGHIGKKFFRALRKNGFEQNIVCFAASQNPSDLVEIEGIPIRGPECLNVADSLLVCVVVHEALRDEMIHTLQQLGVREYVWIYPFLYEMLLGQPLKKKCGSGSSGHPSHLSERLSAGNSPAGHRTVFW